jgi:hypothetical protein
LRRSRDENRREEAIVLRIIEGLPDNVLGVEAIGKVTGEDYGSVLAAAVEEKLGAHRKIRFVYVLGDEFEGWTPGGMWEDVKLAGGDLRAWERIAVVTDKDWVSHAVKAFGWMMPGQVRVFGLGELDAATSWASD